MHGPKFGLVLGWIELRSLRGTLREMIEILDGLLDLAHGFPSGVAAFTGGPR